MHYFSPFGPPNLQQFINYPQIYKVIGSLREKNSPIIRNILKIISSWGLSLAKIERY